ncbi:uncharacterized protein LOC128219779 [Mya arenaria]|uniref:uncharacterized protein LOC128219779 n=1 Tax=Mya arenaria TaxID=6604 RepID=UPI0022E7503C|nr:uncharacterized protein LOC128219779 [Mya arenaria]
MSPHGQTQRNNPRTKQQDNENVDNDAENRPPKKLKKAKGDKSKLKRPLITKAKQKLSHAERQEARRKNVLKIVKTTRGCYFIGVDGEGVTWLRNSSLPQANVQGRRQLEEIPAQNLEHLIILASLQNNSLPEANLQSLRRQLEQMAQQNLQSVGHLIIHASLLGDRLPEPNIPSGRRQLEQLPPQMLQHLSIQVSSLAWPN